MSSLLLFTCCKTKICSPISDSIREQLEGFGVSQENIEKDFSSKKLLTARDIQLDDDHPPAEQGAN